MYLHKISSYFQAHLVELKAVNDDLTEIIKKSKVALANNEKQIYNIERFMNQVNLEIKEYDESNIRNTSSNNKVLKSNSKSIHTQCNILDSSNECMDKIIDAKSHTKFSSILDYNLSKCSNGSFDPQFCHNYADNKLKAGNFEKNSQINDKVPTKVINSANLICNESKLRSSERTSYIGSKVSKNSHSFVKTQIGDESTCMINKNDTNITSKLQNNESIPFLDNKASQNSNSLVNHQKSEESSYDFNENLYTPKEIMHYLNEDKLAFELDNSGAELIKLDSYTENSISQSQIDSDVKKIGIRRLSMLKLTEQNLFRSKKMPTNKQLDLLDKHAPISVTDLLQKPVNVKNTKTEPPKTIFTQRMEERYRRQCLATQTNNQNLNNNLAGAPELNSVTPVKHNSSNRIKYKREKENDENHASQIENKRKKENHENTDSRNSSYENKSHQTNHKRIFKEIEPRQNEKSKRSSYTPKEKNHKRYSSSDYSNSKRNY